MIIGYSTSPNLTTEERLRSLRDSVQRALEELSDLESTERTDITSRITSLEESTDVTCKEFISDAFSTSTYTNVSVDIESVRGYTPYAVAAFMYNAGSHYGYCNIYNARIDSNTAKCGVRVVDGGSAENVKVLFRVLYIANKKLTAQVIPTSSSSGGGGTNDYEALINKPRIELVELTGNKSFGALGLNPLDNMDLAEILV